MSKRRIGGIMQLGYVVSDLDAAIDHWVNKLNVGPFFVNRHARYSRFEYRGSSASPDLSLAFSFSGELNIELIQQHDETPSAFLDFRRDYGEGLQHVGVLSDDLNADTRFLEEKGATSVLTLVNAGSGIETRFFDTQLYPGTMLELIGRTPDLDRHFARMKQSAKDWDGELRVMD